MKQLKFIKTIYLEGKPVWYKDCCYEIIGEKYTPEGGDMYLLFCEDFELRGIGKSMDNILYKVIKVNEEKNKIETKVKINKETTPSLKKAKNKKKNKK